MKHETLGQDELPTPGTLVAIDAEFVSMQQVSLTGPSKKCYNEQVTGRN